MLYKIMILSTFLVSSYGNASELNPHGHKHENDQSPTEPVISLSAHVHGVSEMTIAIEKQNVEIEIISPALNFVGFEHQATTEQEVNQVNNAKSILSQFDALFSFTGNDCKLVKQDIDVSSVIGELGQANELQQANEQERHEHRHEQGHHEKDHHEHQHGQHHQVMHNSHNDITVHYQILCSKADTLLSISTFLFEHFPKLLQLKVMWINNVQQGGITLDPKSTTITLL